MIYLSQDLRDTNKVALVNIRFHNHYWTGTACVTSPHNGDKCYLEAGQHPFVVAMKDKQGNVFTVAFYDGDARKEEQGTLFHQNNNQSCTPTKTETTTSKKVTTRLTEQDLR